MQRETDRAEVRIEMENEIKGSFLYAAAGLLLVLAWFTWFLETPEPINWLQMAGWGVGAAGILLISLALLTLSRRGQPENGKDVAHTRVLVETGIYALVRHPLYLGWVLIYVAVMAIGQYCLTLLFGLLGIGCVTLISRQEDRRLIERFGPRYEVYLQSVPAMNLLAGGLRRIRRRRTSEQNASETK
jgi:protein-S-isoprenylcysteine O-methyltransferase Ste14